MLMNSFGFNNPWYMHLAFEGRRVSLPGKAALCAVKT